MLSSEDQKKTGMSSLTILFKSRILQEILASAINKKHTKQSTKTASKTDFVTNNMIISEENVMESTKKNS